jgi:spore coat protein SA
MKIALINTPWSPVVLPLPSVDSVGNWTATIAQRLTQHEILIYGRQTERLRRVQQYGNIQFRRRRMLWLDDQYVNPLLVRLQGRAAVVSRFYCGTYIRQIARDLRRQNCDVVHVHCFPQFVAVIRKANPKLKIVLHCHEEWLVQFDRAQMKSYIQQADLILGCSQFLVDRFRARFPAEAERFQVMYNGFDQESFLERRSRVAPSRVAPKQLLFVGRVSPEKGVHVLLDAFAQVLAQYPNVELKIVGNDMPLPRQFLQAVSDHPEVQELVRFCDAHYGSTLRANLPAHVRDHVHWLGAVLHTQVIEALSETDILINPSFYESFGNSVIEAMAAGVPVVASAVGGMKETMIPNETGLLVEAGNANQLAAAILTLLQDETACRRMGQAGRRRVSQRFTWDQIVEALLQQYERVIGQ